VQSAVSLVRLVKVEYVKQNVVCVCVYINMGVLQQHLAVGFWLVGRSLGWDEFIQSLSCCWLWC
jgi:hypothetical protein